jgi:long-chain fatty acid transport protein
MNILSLQRTLLALAAAGPLVAHATNGMNIEGYGPVATAMDGASMAYDNGVAAVMNNPATLGLMQEGGRFDLALGFLGPDVNSRAGAETARSLGDSFYMPAVGYARRSGPLTYGFGIFGQGGMGTEYSGSSFMSAGSGLPTRSEVGVGRLLFPLVYEVLPDLMIGGTADYVWAGMDLQMALNGGQFLGMAGGTSGAGTMSGTMVTGFMGMMPMLNPAAPVNWGYFDFSNSSEFSGKARGAGMGGKIGMVWKASSAVTVGASYHTKTRLSDLTTDEATVLINANVSDGAGGFNATTIPLKGKVSVDNFQWPSTVAFGVSFQVADSLQIAADWQRIGWKDVMQDFKMVFTADAVQANPMAAGFANTELRATLYQNWKDQDVMRVGVGFRATHDLTLRAGYNHASNPIPAALTNPLFPAIVEDHYTAGAGYAFGKSSSIDVALSMAPTVRVTNADGVEMSHRQTSWQVMYSNRF